MLAVAALVIGPVPAAAADWQVIRLDVPGGAVTDIRVSGRRTFVLAARQWMEVTACAEHRFCFTPRRPPARRKAPAGALPDGFVARAANGDITQAWYGAPTDRYAHGILGDRIEAGELVAVARGRAYRAAAPEGGVFEDLTPRIADLDGDGRNEILVIESGTGAGAALGVWGLADGNLVRLAATPPIGTTHRWRNPSLIADLDGNGRPEIVEVVTPHIGGTLRIWSYAGPGRLEAVARAAGFSNHAIGSRRLDLAAALDADADGRMELAVPSADRHSLRVMRLAGGSLREVAAPRLPAGINSAVGVVAGEAGAAFIVAPRGGTLHAVAPPTSRYYCVRNGHDERLLFVAEYRNGDRRRRLSNTSDDWCLPRAGLRVIWTFTDEDALEGCSRVVGEESGLVLRSFTAFDNCAWIRGR